MYLFAHYGKLQHMFAIGHIYFGYLNFAALCIKNGETSYISLSISSNVWFGTKADSEDIKLFPIIHGRHIINCGFYISLGRLAYLFATCLSSNLL